MQNKPSVLDSTSRAMIVRVSGRGDPAEISCRMRKSCCKAMARRGSRGFFPVIPCQTRTWYCFVQKGSLSASVRFSCYAVRSNPVEQNEARSDRQSSAVSHEGLRIRRRRLISSPNLWLCFTRYFKPEHVKLSRFRGRNRNAPERCACLGNLQFTHCWFFKEITCWFQFESKD